MTAKYRLTRRAHRDLLAIADYTVKTWGKLERRRYMQALNRRMEWLAENPQLGVARPDIHASCLSYPQGSHIIYYRVNGQDIEILAIFHQSRDVPKLFDA